MQNFIIARLYFSSSLLTSLAWSQIMSTGLSALKLYLKTRNMIIPSLYIAAFKWFSVPKTVSPSANLKNANSGFSIKQNESNGEKS